MSDSAALSTDAIDARLKDLTGWARDGDAIVRELKFGDFTEAFAFMTKVAFAAEAAGHHPEWTNVYNQVRVRLTTHDAGDKVTEQDLALAAAIDAAAASFSA